MKLVYIISLLALEVVAVAGSCVANAFINTMEIVYPKDNMLVHNPYYTKLSAEIAIEADEFTKMQQDFHICASATIDIGAERVEIYKECGRSVFGQGEVRGKEGVNYLQLSLHHLESKLCEVNVTIHCCADVVSAGAVLEAKKQATLNSFMRTGSEFERKIRDSESQLFERTATTTPLNAKMTSQLNVVIGIKSGAMHSPKRESIRATWLKQLHQVSYDAVSIIPYFLIGNSSTAHANATIERLLKVEQLLYQDVLLTDELPVTDSYLLLGQKVLSFMKWISTHSGVSRIDYVVICDDDVYIDMWQLKEHLMYLQQHMSTADHYYAGEVLEQRMNEKYHPIRDIQHRNYLSEAHYPLSVLPPLALGNFYILGSALWRYLALNAEVLQPTGTLEDLSVAVWMMGLQVFPKHLSGVCDISRCLYDPSLFVEDSKTITNTNTNKAPTPHPRLLAVADLQETSEFAQLDQLVSLREQKQWGNSQEALGAMKRTIAQISHHSSQRDFQPAAPTTPAPILAASAPIEPADAFSEAAPLVRTILRCSSCDTSAHSFPSTPEGDTSPSANKPLRLVIVLFDLWYIEENVCLLELVRCDLNRRHVVEIATNTIVADPELLELMKQVGVAVMYFDELSVEKHQATVAAEGSAQRFIDYIASFDVMLEVRSDESSKEMQDVAYTLHKLRHQLSKHLPVPLLVDFTAAYTATIPGQYKGVVDWNKSMGQWKAHVDLSIKDRAPNTLYDALERVLSCQTVPAVDLSSTSTAHLLSATSPTQAPPLSTVYLDEISLILGTQSHYAAAALSRLIALAFPSCRITNFISVHAMATENSSLRMHRVDRDMEIIAELSDEEVRALRSRKSVLLLSVLDCTVLDLSQRDATQQLRWTEHSQQCLDAAVRDTNATSVLFLSGEPLDLSGLRAERVDLLLSTTTDKTLLPINASVYYLPVHAASFFEMNSRIASAAEATRALSPLYLLRSVVHNAATDESCAALSSVGGADATVTSSAACTGRTVAKSRGVAYLYHRCDRVLREAFFRIVQDKMASVGSELVAEALGKCNGGRSSFGMHIGNTNTAVHSRVSSRFQANYVDLAVDMYRPFRFVIAFENSRVGGYITEKLTTAYLAGAVPIYFGAPDVSDYFNPESMINCGEFASLAACADRVLEVHSNETLYQAIASASPIVDWKAWAALFPWEKYAILTTEAKLFVLQLKKKLHNLTL